MNYISKTDLSFESKFIIDLIFLTNTPTSGQVQSRLLIAVDIKKLCINILRSQNLRIHFFPEIKNDCFFFVFFLHKAMEKSYLNLHFKFHHFFPGNNEYIKI